VQLANISGRLALVTDEGGIDVAAASGGRFGPDPQAVYGQWQEFRRWADDATSRGAAVTDEAVPIEERELGAPAPRPAQVFAIGMNYRDHAAEAGLAVPASPATFLRPGQVLSSYLEGIGTMANRLVAPPA
jgi:2-keto-4-pentenoate hydratase/2-oxohepta-3-ene-1,7-dioic acid hydratase in catechol pathway